MVRLGYAQGQNFHLDARHANGNTARLPALAAELIALQPDLVAVAGAVSINAVRQASASIPLLFTIVLDPVAFGMFADAERPGGNMSGVTNFDPAQAPAQMRLLKQAIPGLSRVAILGDRGSLW